MATVTEVSKQVNLRGPGKRLNIKQKEAVLFYVFISPFILMLFALKVIPFIWGIVMSLSNYTGFNMDMIRWIGFKNYVRIFSDKTAYTSLITTLEIALVTVPATLLIALGLALLLNNNIKGVGLFRTIYYFPSIIPAIATATMWRVIFMQKGGVLNTALAAMHLPTINWYGIEMCRTSLIIYILWGSGNGILTYLAALKGVSGELYEASYLDGANYWQRLTRITLPMLSSVIFFNLVNGLIAGWQRFFEPVFLASNSGSATANMGILAVPYTPNYTYLVHVYQNIFVSQRYGYGLALIWFIFILSMLLTRVTFWSQKFWVFNENDVPKEKKHKGGKKSNGTK